MVYVVHKALLTRLSATCAAKGNTSGKQDINEAPGVHDELDSKGK